MHVTPAAISHQIHALEADLGVSLFRRRNRQVELSPSGSLLLPGLSEAFAGIPPRCGGCGRITRPAR